MSDSSNNDSNKNIDKVRPSSYDGIQEYDNDLPRWWVWLFYLTGVYAVFYVVGLYGWGVTIPPVPHEPTGIAMATPTPEQPAAQAAGDDVTLIKAKLTDGAALAKAKEVYMGKCAACHGAQGEGMIGPNLTDPFWIHGGSLAEIQRVIEQGVLDKGMLAWKAMLPKEDILGLVAYIRSMKGSNPANPKAPQGSEYSGE